MVLPRFGQKLEWLVIICNNKKVNKFSLVSTNQYKIISLMCKEV
jgi:hypothetical protein